MLWFGEVSVAVTLIVFSKGGQTWTSGKAGFLFGETDEFGYTAVRDGMDIHDLHATLLHLLGFDHTRLTYRYQGRDFRLTDVSGRVVGEVIG